MQPSRGMILGAALLCLVALPGCGHREQTLTLADVQSTNAPVPSTLIRFDVRPGGRVRIDGTANIIHTRWQVESPLIGGFFEAGSGFPTEPGQTVTPGKMDARAEAFIPVRSLRSVEENGKPYSDSMDDVMYAHLKAKDDPRARIVYRLKELTLKEPPASKDAPYSFEARGDLVVAGVTNEITTPVSILPLGNRTLKIAGTNAVKMTSFRIEPPAPKIALGALKTGDDVTLSFQWIVAQRTNAAAAPK